MKNIHKILIAIGTVLTLFLLTASLTHASLTPVSWIRDTVAGFVRPGILTDTLRIPSLTNCDTIDTDADGDFACGTDSGGGGSGDITAVGDVTTGDAFTGTAGTTLTFNNAGGDGILDYDGTDFNFDKSISLGTAGVRLSGDGDGAITFRGLGNGSDEDLTLNLDDTSNVGTFSSSTGLSRLSYSNIEQQDGGNAWKLAYNNSSYFGNGSGAILRTGFGGVTSPSAKIHIGAGTTGANTAPLMFTAGTNMTTPQAGAIEFDGTDLFYTTSSPTRRTVANLDASQTLTNKTIDGDLNTLQDILPTSLKANSPTDEYCYTYEATGPTGEWQLCGGGSGNTLDQAYDQGGAGVGRSITADTGAVEITVPDIANNAGLIIDQNDDTNYSAGVEIMTSSGDAYYPAALSLYNDTTQSAGLDGATGSVMFYGKDSGGNKTLFGDYFSNIYDNTNGSEDGYFQQRIVIGGTVRQILGFLGTSDNRLNVGASNTNARIASNGNNDLIIETGNSTTGNITLVDGANGNIVINPNGTGEARVGSNKILTQGDMAVAAGLNTGTSTTTVVTPDALAGSYAGSKELVVNVLERNYTVTTGDRKACVTIPSTMNGMNIVEVGANVYTTSSSGTPTIQIARGRQASATSAHSFVDVLSTRITIDANEYDSKDATTAPVINTSNDDLATGDLICGDIDVTGTGTKGLSFRVIARLP